MQRGIEVRGAPYEVGLTEGRGFRDVIAEAYRRFCEPFVGPPAADLLASFDRELERRYPALAQEIKGIGEGSGLGYEKALHWNFFDEVEEACSRPGDGAAGDGQTCSTVVFTDGPDGPVMGKTTELGPGQWEFYRVRTVRPEQGNGFVCLSRAGHVGCEAGINTKGLALGVNSARTVDFGARALGRLMLGRPIMQYCASVAQGIETLARDGPSWRPMHYVLLDRAGNAAVVERSPSRIGVRRPVSGVVFCTNVFVESGMEGMNDEAHADFLADARSRLGRLQLLLEGDKAARTAERGMGLLHRILTDHGSGHGSEGALCRHGAQSMILETCGTSLINVRNAILLQSDGPACQTGYSSYALGRSG